jgi:hypothetical protein
LRRLPRVKQKDIAMHTSIAAVAERPFARHFLVATTAGLAFSLAAALPAKAQDTIKVGILHSLSGTMAISETTLKDVMLMLIEEQNKKGGLLGKKLEAVVVDPASNWPLFAEKARELITKDKVAAVFGCWTSVSRKSVLPVFKELNNILFYPVQYEGEESERNVFYTGAAPNHNAVTSKKLHNHHITKPVYIGEVRADGQFDVVWKTPTLVPGDAWSKYLPGSKDLEADWVTLKCGNYNTVTKKCGGGA